MIEFLIGVAVGVVGGYVSARVSFWWRTRVGIQDDKAAAKWLLEKVERELRGRE